MMELRPWPRHDDYNVPTFIRDEDGYFFIVNRKKDMIIAGGFNVYPREINETLFQHPRVREALSAGIADPYRRETVRRTSS